MKYLIPNAPLPPFHLGDLLQVEPLIEEIMAKDANSEIVVYSSKFPYLRTVINKHNNNLDDLLKPTPGRIKAFTVLPQVFKLLKDFKNSDASIFTGGNYFREDGDGKNSRTFFYHLFLFALAKIFAKKKIVMPISFGPFQKNIWKKSSIKGLSGFDLVMARNEDTFDELEKAGLKNIVSSFDASLLLPKSSVPKKTDGIALVISNSEEDDYTLVDAQLAKALGYISRRFKLPVTPIIIKNGDSTDQNSVDYKSYLRMKRIFTRYKVRINKLEYAPGSAALVDIYQRHKFVVAMRLHPILLAISQEIPFIAINRNQKTREVLKSLEMENYYLQAHTLNLKILKAKMLEVFGSRRKVKKHLTTKNEEVKKTLRKQIKFSTTGITHQLQTN